jgi:hypothetical protein
VRGTLDNLEQLGVPAALTGPIARGDTDTVRLHLARLSPDDQRYIARLVAKSCDWPGKRDSTGRRRTRWQTCSDPAECGST